MSIHIGKKDVEGIHVGKKTIVAVYEGLHLVWEAITSCFGSGWWINDRPWKDDDGWKNSN